MRGAGVIVGSIQGLVDCLGKVAATIDAYRQCSGCYYSSNEALHCGLGMVPTEVCTDRQLLITED